MGFWKSSEVFGINYYMMRTPDNHYYVTGDPQTAPGAAASEVMLMASVKMNQDVVFWEMWNRGIVPLERQIMNRLKQAPIVARKVANPFSDVLDIKIFGALLIVTVFEDGLDANVGTPRRSYHSTHIETTGLSYQSAANSYASRDKLLPAMEGMKIAFYHIWAIRS